MKISEHIENTIERWRTLWGEILGAFLAGIISKGSQKLLSELEKEAEPGAKDFLDRFPIHPAIKGELQAFMDRRSPVHIPAFAAMAIGVVIGSIIGTFMGWAAPIAKWTSYQGEKVIHSFRLDPLAIITAWRRDPAKYEKLFDDLRDQGWSDDRIKALKFYTQAFPTLIDVVRFYAREAFEPDMIERYGLMDEVPPYEGTLFEKLGVPKEIADLYWIAHWEHASWMQVVEMLRRGQLTEDEVREWFRVVEIPPYWRDKLIAISYEVPTRVDVRRFWDMRTIDEARLREIYAWRGYHGKDLDDYVLWTKVYVAFPDLLARWKNGWITIDDVRAELTGLGMPADRVEEMIQTKIKPTEPERVSEELDLTKAEICAGVKKGVISWDEGIELLQDIGKSREEAEFIMEVKVGVAGGSPETYPEFKAWTQGWRKAAGMEVKPVTEDLKQAAAEVVKLTKEVEALQEAVKAEGKTLIAEEVLPEEATARRDELRVTLHRAESALRAAQTNYNSLVAEWRHKGEV